MNRKYFLPVFVALFLFNSVFTSLFSQEKELDSIRTIVANSSKSKEDRFNKIMELASIYRKYQPRLEKVVEGFDEDYLQYGVEALKWAEEYGSPKQLAQARRFEIDYYRYLYLIIDKNNLDLVFKGQQMISEGIFYSLEDEFVVYRELTDLYNEKQFFKEFLELVTKKFDLARQLKKPFSESFWEYSAIGTIYYKQQDYETARVYYKKTLDAITSSDHDLFRASVNNNIALSYTKEEKTDSAINYYNKSLKIIESALLVTNQYQTDHDIEHLKNVIKSNISYLGVKKGEYDMAITAIKKELFSGKMKKEPSTIVQAYNKLGEIYYYKKQYVIAEKYLDSARKSFIGGIHDKDQINNLNHRAKILLATNKQYEANKLFRKAQQFEDSISIIKSSRQTKIASVLYETQAKETELQKQRLELVKQNEEILKKEKTQIIYSVVLIVLIASLLVFYWFNRKIQYQKEQVEAQKKLVDSSLKEKEILLKEVHHRVKNNLQVISSLLIKQGSVSDDEQVKKLMIDGQNRIKSMAMVHQLLYQTEDFRNINLKEYTNLLVNSISDSHQFKEMDITFKIHMEDIHSHIDIAVPYGLILNELLSNCFEHGFTKGGPGSITVTVNHLQNEDYQLIVSDTGQGITENIDQKMKKSLGINLVKGLAWQLRGDLSFSNASQGSRFEVTFQNNLKNVS